MKLDTFRRLDDHQRRIRQLERTEAETGGGGGGDHADSDHADAFSALAHAHTGVYAPVEHDPDHDDRFALIAHTHPVHADSDHDDRFSLLAHVHVVAWADITGKPSTFTPAEHDSDHSDVFSPLAHTHAAHADSDHDDRFSLLAHVHDWSVITGKPSTFTPTPQALDWLTDVATAGQASTNVLTFNGTSWVPSAIPAQSWTSITGKPATFPPDEHDSAHDDRFSLLAHVHTGVYVPAGQGVPAGGTTGQVLAKTSGTDYATGWQSASAPAPQPLDWLTDVATAGQTTTNVLTYNGTAWTPAAVPAQTWTSITGKPSTFTPAEHDSDHDDRFSLLAHTHAAHADSDHDDRFSLLAHAHTGVYVAVPGAWTTMTPLTSPWTAGSATPRYRLEGDVVRLGGQVQRPSGSNTAVFTLPSGFRPVATHAFTVPATGAFGRLTVSGTATGVVNFTTGTATGDVSLDGITFSTT